MIPIKDFPYGNDMSERNPMHHKTLLMQMNSVARSFAVGYYDAIHDVFCVCCSPFINTEGHRYENHPVGGRYFSDYNCIMPAEFIWHKGPRAVLKVELLDEVLADMEDRNLFNEDIDGILKTEKFMQPYLVCTKDKHIIITETSAFCDYGTQFEGFQPSVINGVTYHGSGILPKEDIQFAVNLTKYYRQEGEQGG